MLMLFLVKTNSVKKFTFVLNFVTLLIFRAVFKKTAANCIPYAGIYRMAVLCGTRIPGFFQSRVKSDRI